MRALVGTASLVLGAAPLACTQTLDFDSLSSSRDEVSSGCGAHPDVTFCDDFDGEPPGNLWLQGVDQLNGTAAVDYARAVSAPGSLLTESFALGAGAGTVRAVAATSFPQFDTQKMRIKIGFDLIVEAYDPNAGANLMAFQLLYGPLDDFNQFVLNLTSNGTAVTWKITENAGGATPGFQQHGPFNTPTLTQDWVHFDIEIDVLEPVGAANTFSIRTNGDTTIATKPLGVPLKGSFPRLELGIGWVDTSRTTQPWSIRYDNFVIDVQPFDGLDIQHL